MAWLGRGGVGGWEGEGNLLSGHPDDWLLLDLLLKVARNLLAGCDDALLELQPGLLSRKAAVKDSS